MPAPLAVLHEDEHLLVIDKPPGILSVPDAAARSRSVPEILAEAGGAVLPVHRLDLEVSGALLLAKDEDTRAALEVQFRERAIHKTYWAMAQGRVRAENGTWHWPILESGAHARVSAQGRPSQTRWSVLQRHEVATELEIDLVTGRRNQIRVHAAHAGHPLVGERKYARGRDATLPFRSRRIALHAWRIAFRHPAGGGEVRVEAPLPADLLDLRARAAQARQDRAQGPPRGGSGGRGRRRPGRS